MAVSLSRPGRPYQRRHSRLGFPLAVIYKYFDDRGSHLAALITYYAFVSLFPLLLLVYSVLGFILQGRSERAQDIEHSLLKDFPVIGLQPEPTTSRDLEAAEPGSWPSASWARCMAVWG